MRLKTLLILPLLVVSLGAASVDDLTFTQNGQTFTVSSCNDTASGSLIIPSTYQGLPVTSIESLSHTVNNYSNNLSAITIPDSVTSIGEMAFIRCQNLTDIIVSESNNSYRSVDGFLLNKSGDTLAAYPTGRNYLADTIPDSVTIIGNSAFRGNANITAITIPDNITTIEEAAFLRCDNITSVSIPSSVTSISTTSFYWTYSMTEFIVDDTNTSYFSEDGVLFEQLVDGISIFAYPSAKNSGDTYTIPDGVTIIGERSFVSAGLSNIIFPDSVTAIETFAFAHSSIPIITIPDSVVTIAGFTFFRSLGLTSVIIGDGITTIEADTFLECPNLENVIIGSNVKTIGDYAFSGSSSLTNITFEGDAPNVGRFSPNGVIYYYNDATGFTSPTWQGIQSEAISRPAPIIAGIEKLEVGVNLWFNSASGQSYRIESSTDLESWTSLEDEIVSEGDTVIRYYDTVGIQKRFYRVKRND
jgi:hypothetical protein